MENLKQIQTKLKKDANRNELINHTVLKFLKDEKLSHGQIAKLLSQWYFPLANFPFFLASCISHIKITEIQTFLSDILHEELGCGDPGQSHLALYESTMKDAGFSTAEFINTNAYDATVALVDGYKYAAKNENRAIGFVYATEVADLAMVSSIGYSVANISGKTLKELPWADIHIKQEPNHVNNVNNSIDISVSESDAIEMLKSAQLCWKLWVDFFEEIGSRIGAPDHAKVSAQTLA